MKRDADKNSLEAVCAVQRRRLVLALDASAGGQAFAGAHAKKRLKGGENKMKKQTINNNNNNNKNK